MFEFSGADRRFFGLWRHGRLEGLEWEAFDPALLSEFLWPRLGHYLRHADARNPPAYPSAARVKRRPLRSYCRTRLLRLRQSHAIKRVSGSAERGKPLVYAPQWPARLQGVLDTLSEGHGLHMAIAASDPGGQGDFLRFPRYPVHAWDLPAKTISVCVRRVREVLSDRHGIPFSPSDLLDLREEVTRVMGLQKRVETELRRLRPSAVLVISDNHPPHQNLVLAARKQGIPSVMVQHGLDCEHQVLDEAYADYFALWGPERAERYRRLSHHQPAVMQVVGYPFAPRQRPALGHGGKRVLWVSRPHAPSKCYLPSRHPDEGRQILEACLEGMAALPEMTLAIRTHPYDDRGKLRDVAKNNPAERRVRFSDASMAEDLAQADVVISEDSTAALDAIFAGKPLVHAHFAPSPPVLPLVPGQAALPGFSGTQLIASLRKTVGGLNQSETADMERGQIDFAAEHAGSPAKTVTEELADVLRHAVANGKPS